MTRLRRVSGQVPGISRRRRGRGFSYDDARGRTVTDTDTLERIRSLAIPPAWTDVWICPWPDGHLQALGTDSAGRRQYLYHEAWRARRDIQKFHRVERFAEALPVLRAMCNGALRRRGFPREKSLALAIRLLDEGSFRLGSEAYARENGTFGLATIRRGHVQIAGSRITFDFTAKSGKRQVQTIANARLARIVRTLKERRGGDHELLAYQEDGRWYDLRSADINDHLHELAGDGFTAKDFRTWQATVLAAVLLASRDLEPENVTSRRRAVTAVVKDVAEHLGNTPAVCRASYIDPRVIDRWMEGTTIADVIRGIDVDAPFDLATRERIERAVLDLLREGSRSAAAA
jgi:DNA topoisomerase I